jgi:hypothetical protein
MPKPRIKIEEDLPVCERCGSELDPGKATWLELNNHSGLYSEENGTVPIEESQGAFPFGSDCRKIVLENGGELKRTAPQHTFPTRLLRR